jgi:hypothetical protein
MASQRLLWGLAGMIAIFTFKLSDLIAGRYAGRKVNPTKPCFLTPRDAAELQRSMSALGQKRTLKHVHPMSALPPIADIAKRVGFGYPQTLRFITSLHLRIACDFVDYQSY